LWKPLTSFYKVRAKATVPKVAAALEA